MLHMWPHLNRRCPWIFLFSLMMRAKWLHVGFFFLIFYFLLILCVICITTTEVKCSRWKLQASLIPFFGLFGAELHNKQKITHRHIKALYRRLLHIYKVDMANVLTNYCLFTHPAQRKQDHIWKYVYDYTSAANYSTMIIRSFQTVCCLVLDH